MLCIAAGLSVTGWCLLQGDPSCRRSAILKDDTLLEFYYDDTRTAYDMFQRGLMISGDAHIHTHFIKHSPLDGEVGMEPDRVEENWKVD